MKELAPILDLARKNGQALSWVVEFSQENLPNV
jgi:hypothetical protein